MIRRCTDQDVPVVCDIINDAAQAYRGVIPTDRWREPYMPVEELIREMKDGVDFWGCETNDGELAGVMGLQDRGEVRLIRHAYVRTNRRCQGIGSSLLRHLTAAAGTPFLVGTWAAADWAIRFYERHGFHRVPDDEKNRLLRRFWKIPDRQIETSVVLADQRWTSPAP